LVVASIRSARYRPNTRETAEAIEHVLKGTQAYSRLRVESGDSLWGSRVYAMGTAESLLELGKTLQAPSKNPP
jgi:hypothetical protein